MSQTYTRTSSDSRYEPSLAPPQDSFWRNLRLRYKAEHSSDNQIIEALLEAIQRKDLAALRVYSKTASLLIRSRFSDYYETTEKLQQTGVIQAILSGIHPKKDHDGLEYLLFRAINKNSEIWTNAILRQGNIIPLEDNGRFAKQCGVEASDKSLKALVQCSPKERYWVTALALVEAIEANNTDFALSLIKAGITDQWQNGISIFYYPDSNGRDQNLTRRDEKNPLMMAINRDNLRLTEVLLERLKVTSSMDMLHVALKAACHRENSALFRMIIDAGADLGFKNNEILTEAIDQDQVGRVGFYISEGAQFTSQHFISARRNKTKVDRLLNHLAPVLNQNEAKTLKQVQRLLPESTPKIIKTDAINPSLSLQRQPLMYIYLRSSLAAGVLSDFRPDDLSYFSQQIFSEDVKRVENTKGLSWARYVEAIEDQGQPISEFVDTIKEVAETLIIPLIVEKGVYSEDALNPMLTMRSIKNLATRIAAHLIAIDKSTLDLIILNARWHRAGNRCPDELRPYLLIGDWAPLFDGAIDIGNDFTIECLHTPTMLKDEGSAMSHCVGGYASSCRSGRSQILSIRKEGFSQATIELVVSDKGNLTFGNTRWRVAQFQGKRNSKVSHETEQAFERFCFEVREGRVPSSKKYIEAKSNLSIAAQNELEETLGFALEDAPMVREKLLEHYDERVFVERGKTRIPLLSERAKDMIRNKLEDLHLTVEY